MYKPNQTKKDLRKKEIYYRSGLLKFAVFFCNTKNDLKFNNKAVLNIQNIIIFSLGKAHQFFLMRVMYGYIPDCKGFASFGMDLIMVLLLLIYF